jgi:hypothetical protein
MGIDFTLQQPLTLLDKPGTRNQKNLIHMKTILLLSFFFFSVMLSQSQWSYTDLTESKFRMGVTSLGTRAFFAGGESSNGQVSAIEIYDITLEDWDTVINLVFPRSHIATVSCGAKVFFAGGLDFGTFTFYDIVEIWDVETGLWSFEQLAAPRFSMSAISYENKVMFAGGTNFIMGTSFDLVEIYDIETDEWEITHLSIPRAGMSSAIAGDLAFFAGGSDVQGNITNRVDIYNFTTDTWSIDSLSESRTFTAATAIGPKVLFAGGTTPENETSSRVDIYDTETGEWSTAELSQARAFWDSNAAARCDQFAYFVGGGIFNLNNNQYGYPFNTIDIYDLVNDEWTTDTTYAPLLAHSVIGVDDHLLIAGGVTPVDISSRVQILNDTCLWSDVRSAVGGQRSAVECYPNPTSGIVDFRISNFDFRWVSLKVYDVQGREVAVVLDGRWSGDQVVRWDASALPAGIYFYQLRAEGEGQVGAGKIVKYKF